MTWAYPSNSVSDLEGHISKFGFSDVTLKVTYLKSSDLCGLGGWAARVGVMSQTTRPTAAPPNLGPVDLKLDSLGLLEQRAVKCDLEGIIYLQPIVVPGLGQLGCVMGRGGTTFR